MRVNICPLDIALKRPSISTNETISVVCPTLNPGTGFCQRLKRFCGSVVITTSHGIFPRKRRLEVQQVMCEIVGMQCCYLEDCLAYRMLQGHRQLPSLTEGRGVFWGKRGINTGPSCCLVDLTRHDEQGDWYTHGLSLGAKMSMAETSSWWQCMCRPFVFRSCGWSLSSAVMHSGILSGPCLSSRHPF